MARRRLRARAPGWWECAGMVGMRRDGGNARGWANVQGLPRYILIAQRAGASLFYLCYAARRGRPLCLPFFKANAQGWAAAWRLLSAARRGSSLCLPAQSTPGHASHTVHVLMPQGSRQPFRIHPRPRGARVHPRPRGTQERESTYGPAHTTLGLVFAPFFFARNTRT